jgi:hypothetical protein
MKSGDFEFEPADDLMTLDEQVPFDAAEPATYDDEFLVQQQKIERLTEYYDQVVAELLILLNESQPEVV